MNNPKRHHFVPAGYLYGFIEDGTNFLNIFSKRSGLWRKQKPEQVMVRNKYYYQSWVPDGVDKNILEKSLGSWTEPKGLEALNRLIESPETLDDEDIANILVYIEFQRIRVPRQADMAKSLATNAITLEILKAPEGQEALKYAEVVMKDSFRFDFMKMVQGSMTPYLSKMIWELIEAEHGTSFITSDSPVTFFNADFLPPTEAGVALYGTIVLFPVNKKFLLKMHHSEYETGEKGTSEHLPIYPHVEDGVIEIRRGTIWGEENVNRQNWIMHQLSQDLVVGESKEILEIAIGKTLEGH